jgi:hypothetical protein
MGGALGRNSWWRMKPPASAVQIERRIDMMLPRMTAEANHLADLGNLIMARRATRESNAVA